MIAKVEKFPLVLERNKGGKPLSILRNFVNLLKNKQITVRSNEISKRIDIHIPGQTFSRDKHFVCCLGYITSLLHEHGMSSADLKPFLETLADHNRYNPIAEWIESIPWDGESRLKDFFNTVVSENQDLKETLMTRWAISAIAALYEPEGVSGAGVLVLQGDQYLGKTNWFNNLVPRDMRAFTREGVCLDLENKDRLIEAISYWLVELGEIEQTMKRCGEDALKAFLGNNMDIVRPPYGVSAFEYSRRTVFCGTVNAEQFLRDRTGNRRFFTIACKKINHTHGLDMQQVWAEFKTLYDNKEPWHLTREEVEDLAEANHLHDSGDPMKDEILMFYNWQDYNVASSEIDWKNATQVLKEIGWKSKSRTDNTVCGLLLKKLCHGRRKMTRDGAVWAIPKPKISTLI